MQGPITFRDIDALIFLHPSVKRWLEGKPDSTVYNNYGRNLLYFTERHNIVPESLLPQQVIDEEGTTVQSLKPLAIMDLLLQIGREETNAKASRVDNAIRSYCKENGRIDLPRSKLRHIKEKWYRGYTKEEARKLVGYVTKPLFKLYVYINLESGLRASHVLAIKYKHIKQDLEAGLDTIAIRFEPKYYFAKGKKAGFTFIGKQSIDLLRECIKDGLISTDPEANIFRSRKHSTFKRTSITEVITLAKEKAHLDPDLQPTHGLRKYFENALDEAKIAEKAKEMIEGHYPDTRAKHYSNRDFEYLRQHYQEAYPFIDLRTNDPRLPTKIQELEKELEELRFQRNIIMKEKNDMKEKDYDVARVMIHMFGTPKGRETMRRALEFADLIEANPTFQKLASSLESRENIPVEEVIERVDRIIPRVISQIRPDLRTLPPELREQLKKPLLETNG